MTSKNIFLILLLGFVAIVFAFNFVIYSPIEQEQELLEKQLLETKNKFNNANHAKLDLKNIREKLANENNKLEDIKQKFITKSELSSITFKMRDRTREFNLKLIDFTPVFKFYFADTSKTPVKALPFSVTVSGKFVDIGKFIESWNSFNFYVVPDELEIVKMNNKTNKLEAIIVGRFYAWSKDQG